MDEKVKEDVYDLAFQVWGIPKQLDVCIEELCELVKAICKWKRTEKWQVVPKHVIEEIADVEIMLGQLRSLIDDNDNLEELNTVKDSKLNRTLEKIQEILRKK